MSDATAAGTVKVGDLALGRLGYGVMQLRGSAGHDDAVAVLREALALGVRHVDTADFYGPGTSNALIREALYPYPEDLVIVTKVGWERGANGGLAPAPDAGAVQAQVERNLIQLGVEALDVGRHPRHHVVAARAGQHRCRLPRPAPGRRRRPRRARILRCA